MVVLSQSSCKYVCAQSYRYLITTHIVTRLCIPWINNTQQEQQQMQIIGLELFDQNIVSATNSFCCEYSVHYHYAVLWP